MFIIYFNTLKSINILNFINKIFLNSACTFNLKNIMRIYRTIGYFFTGRYFITFLNKNMFSKRNIIFLFIRFIRSDYHDFS